MVRGAPFVRASLSRPQALVSGERGRAIPASSRHCVRGSHLDLPALHSRLATKVAERSEPSGFECGGAVHGNPGHPHGTGQGVSRVAGGADGPVVVQRRCVVPVGGARRMRRNGSGAGGRHRAELRRSGPCPQRCRPALSPSRPKSAAQGIPFGASVLELRAGSSPRSGGKPNRSGQVATASRACDLAQRIGSHPSAAPTAVRMVFPVPRAGLGASPFPG